MLQVIFTRGEDISIKKFEKLDFPDAVEMTATVEQKCRAENKEISSDFYLIEADGDGTAIYEGAFSFGSRYAPNLFLHIKKKLEEMRLSKEQQQARLELIAKMETDLPDQYKKEEPLEQSSHFSNVEGTHISKLKKWQRRLIYSSSGILAFMYIGTVFF